MLKDPASEKVRYVGKTNNPKQRYRSHTNKANRDRGHKYNWIMSLKRDGLRPIFEIIKEIPITEWKYWERYYINYYKSIGCDLTNCCGGGEGLNFGNRTSFTKGQESWNKGTRIKKQCAICPKEFEISPTGNKKYKCCSMECSRIYRSMHPNSGAFKKGLSPWNKGVGGYTTSRKGSKVPDSVRKKISNTLKGKYRNCGSSKSVIQIDKAGNKIHIYPSATEASRVTGIKKGSIINNTNGRSKSAGGYCWIKED